MMLGWRAKIGQIRPATAIEGAEEWRTVAPKGVAFADARTIVPRVDNDGLEVMMAQVITAAEQLATSKVDLIVQCGAPGTFLKGAGADEQIKKEIFDAVGIPAITMAESAIVALKAVGAESVAVGTIYTDDVNEALAKTIEAAGLRVAAIEGLQITDPYEASLHDADSAYRLGRSVFRKAGKADAILISCGTYRTFETLPYLEMDTGAAVISSNQSTLWHALRTLGLPDRIPELGRLWQY
ncbi:decarboxylase [Rhodococcus sp. ABRD24]|uniref:maleate cis-trans isomerase family protein n=1 Tax=Rhodococcus sp. ABRD24 TaxID=2507582 RepID=UPI0010403A43|nr:decarboxylase [Rhodococcus sp. ABRD24]QBJ96720.1 decarboxylase [Rhodococcus sp. ABRD24]